MSAPDPDIVYKILVAWAAQEAPRTYTDLSNDYLKSTGDWHEPHGSWDRVLGLINNRTWKEIKAPAISALVIKKETGEPGGNFWDCAPNVPAKPKDDAKRIAEWVRIVKEVIAFDWPKVLP